MGGLVDCTRKTSSPRTFSLIFTNVSPSGNALTVQRPSSTPMDVAMARASGRLELPLNIFTWSRASIRTQKVRKVNTPPVPFLQVDRKRGQEFSNRPFRRKPIFAQSPEPGSTARPTAVELSRNLTLRTRRASRRSCNFLRRGGGGSTRKHLLAIWRFFAHTRTSIITMAKGLV